MDKTPVNTKTLEETLVEGFTELIPNCVYEENPDVKDKITALVDEFRAAFEHECFEAWDIAQGLTYNKERDDLADQKRKFAEEVDRFNAHKRAHDKKHEPEA